MPGTCDSLLLIGVVLGTSCAIVTALLIVMLRPLLARYALARPNARSSHKVPTPQGGGMAIVIAATAGIASVLVLCPRSGPASPVLAALAASTCLAIVGAADDIFVLRAAPRLALQLLSAALIVIVGGARVVPAVPVEVEVAVLVLALVWFVNLVNFMDGIDWITVAEVVPICAGIATIAALGEAPVSSFVVAIAVGGATLGFAPFNRPVARLFLGDVGSLPLGLLLGWQLIVVAASHHLVAAVILPLYYLADATITLGRRIARRERVWEAHRTHYYQRATDRGYTVIAIVARVFVTNLVLIAIALASVLRPESAVQVGCLAVGAGVVAWLLVTLHRGVR